jgi:membrane protein implicated in regulation of membrane protease activity
MAELIESTRDSLERVQEYDTDQIPRPELGAHLVFDKAVEPAKNIIFIFRQISINHIDALGQPELQIIKTQADGFYNILATIEAFDPEKPENNAARRDQIVDQLIAQKDKIFSQLHPIISYLTARMTDFSQLEHDARAAVQAAKDEAAAVAIRLAEHEDNAKQILETVQKVAAEQGVSQQAIYYKEEAELHESEANKWRNWTFGTALLLGAFAVASLFIHKIPFLIPNNYYETIQLAISKFLIFAVISYMLLLCARNFLSHKHNAIVNKHRQNALVTFTALVDAASEKGNQDIVLTHAAECIFSPQDTGYGKHATATSGSASVQTIIPTLGHGLRDQSGA